VIFPTACPGLQQSANELPLLTDDTVRATLKQRDRRAARIYETFDVKFELIL